MWQVRYSGCDAVPQPNGKGSTVLVHGEPCTPTAGDGSRSGAVSKPAAEEASVSTVTVTRCGTQYTLQFSQLPGKTFGPWGFAEIIRELTVSALLSPLAARNLVIDASTGTATAEMGR